MLAVSDTTPLLSLAIVDRLALLPAVFETVVVPAGVIAELQLGSGRLGASRLHPTTSLPWLSVGTVADVTSVAALRGRIDQGEAEVVVLARQLGIRRVLIDDRAGRAEARRWGLSPTGTLGVLLAAKQLGVLPRVGPVILELEAEAGLYVGARLREAVLRAAGER